MRKVLVIVPLIFYIGLFLSCKQSPSDMKNAAPQKELQTGYGADGG